MIRTVKVLCCDNEHGSGDQTFPPLDKLDPMQDATAVQLRRAAKQAGWIRLRQGGDYCDLCAEGVSGRGEA